MGRVSEERQMKAAKGDEKKERKKDKRQTKESGLERKGKM